MIGYAWRFLRFDRARTAGAVLGSVVAVFLIGQQLGIARYLTSAMVAPVPLLPAGLWVTDRRTTNVNALGALDARVTRLVAAQPGVASAEPLAQVPATARFADGTIAAVTLLGVTDPARRGLPPLEVGTPRDLWREGTVQFDRFDRPTFGGADVGDAVELNGHAAVLAVRSAGVRTFTSPLMIMPLARAQSLGGQPSTRINAVLVDLSSGADARQTAEAIERAIPGVRAWTPDALVRATQQTILATTGIAASIGTLVVFAVLVGAVIIGLTLYAAVLERLRDYGTLKAMGATDGAVTALVLWQAGLVALVGGGLGVTLVLGFRAGVSRSGVLFAFPPAVWVGLVVGTMGLAALGATLAIRRVRRLEPSAVFRG